MHAGGKSCAFTDVGGCANGSPVDQCDVRSSADIAASGAYGPQGNKVMKIGMLAAYGAAHSDVFDVALSFGASISVGGNMGAPGAEVSMGVTITAQIGADYSAVGLLVCKVRCPFGLPVIGECTTTDNGHDGGEGVTIIPHYGPDGTSPPP